MRILITGIEGFAGRHLARSLMEAGHEISGTVQSPRDVRSLKRVLGKVPLVHADLRYSRSLERPLSRLAPEYIVHLAAQSSGTLAMRDPALTYRTNTLGTLNLLETLRRMAWEGKVLIVSSADVYGSATILEPFREDDPLVPLNHYAASKAMMELLAIEYFTVHGIRTLRARPFPHTGPGQSERFALSNFARQIAEAEVCGRGTVRVGNLGVVRDYLDVRDVASAYRSLLEGGKDGEVYNISRGQPQRLGEILESMLKGSSARIDIEEEQKRLRPLDIEYQVGDSTKLRKETRWKPLIPLERTLADLLDYWREKGRGVRKRVDK
jgi:GDP-4-dehydro-6-deoxy-D-mannose reductase